MIVVTGATGKLGRLVVQQLVERVPASRVGVSVRDPGKASDLQALGVRVRRGDFDDPASLDNAFEGAEQLLIVSSNAAAQGRDPLAQHRQAIDAARRSGVRRVLYTSHMGVGATSAFPPMRDHAASEDMLRGSGLAWTALRHGFYASTVPMLMSDALTSGVIQAPADGKVSWTTHADLAEADAIILAEEGRWDGPTPPLTGPEALNLQDIAAIAAEVSGRPVRREIIADHELKTRMAARGAPPAAVEITLGLYRASGAGEFASVDPTLERLLRRPLETMRDVLERAVRSGRA